MKEQVKLCKLTELCKFVRVFCRDISDSASFLVRNVWWGHVCMLYGTPTFQRVSDHWVKFKYFHLKYELKVCNPVKVWAELSFCCKNINDFICTGAWLPWLCVVWRNTGYNSGRIKRLVHQIDRLSPPFCRGCKHNGTRAWRTSFKRFEWLFLLYFRHFNAYFYLQKALKY